MRYVCEDEKVTQFHRVKGAERSHHSAIWVTVYLPLQLLPQSCSYLLGKGGMRAEEVEADTEGAGSSTDRC